jgi:hypothetical protein
MISTLFSLLALVVILTAVVGGYASARRFVRERLRFVDAAQRRSTPWVAAAGAWASAPCSPSSCPSSARSRHSASARPSDSASPPERGTSGREEGAGSGAEAEGAERAGWIRRAG